MGWSRPDEESHADHDRDSRKHDWRPGDRGFEAASRDEVPARLDRPISTAEDIVALVKLQPNWAAAAKLIELYAGMKAAQALREDAAQRLLAIEAREKSHA